MNRLRLRRPGAKGAPRPTGQTLVEFALVVLVFLLVLMLIIEVGRLLHAFITIQHAAQVGARFAVTGRTDSEWIDETTKPRLASVKARTEAAMRGLVINHNPKPGINNPGDYVIWVRSGNPARNDDPGNPGERVVVTVQYSLPLITPLLSNIVTSVPLTAQAVMTVETEGGGLTEEGVLPPALDIAELSEDIPDSWDDDWELEYFDTLDYSPDNPPPDPEDDDSDICGLPFGLEEEEEYGTDPFDEDTDGDGIDDCTEALIDDTDPTDPTDFTPTETPAPSSTPGPCGVQFDDYYPLVAGGNSVHVIGYRGDRLDVYGQLGTDDPVLLAGNVVLAEGEDWWCDVAREIPITGTLVADQYITIISQWGWGNAQDFVRGGAYTLTPSATATSTPTPTETPTVIPITYPYFDIASTSCQSATKATVTLNGFNWPSNQGRIYIEWYIGEQWKQLAVIDQPTATWVRTVKLSDDGGLNGTYPIQARTQFGSISYNTTVDLSCGPTPTPTQEPTAPPGKATLISPSGTISDTTPLYKWYAVQTATQYRLEVDGTIIEDWFDASCMGGTCSVEHAGTPLTYTNHTWRIQAWNEYGEGSWSNSKTFTVVLYSKYVNTGDPAELYCQGVHYGTHDWLLNRAWNDTSSTDDWGYISGSNVQLSIAYDYLARGMSDGNYLGYPDDWSGQILYGCYMTSNGGDYTIGYNFEVPDGTYRVRLVFSECSESAPRYFDIEIEGTQMEDDFDIAQTALGGCQSWCTEEDPYNEGKRIAVDWESPNISVADGLLEVRLIGNQGSDELAPILMGVGVYQIVP